MATRRQKTAPEWQRVPSSDHMPVAAVSAIARRRRQMLVHCCLYYRMDQPVIDDHTWTKWAKQLSALQDKFGWEIGFYDAVFADWDGSSGFHLPADPDVIRVARRTLETVDKLIL